MFGIILCGIGGWLIGYHGTTVLFDLPESRPNNVMLFFLGILLTTVGFLIP